MKIVFIATMTLFTLAFPVSAQVTPNEQTTEFVTAVTEAFFDLLPEDNFSSERAFMTDSFAAAMPLNAWRRGRERLIAVVGSTPRYTAHNLTYYERDPLLAAVDFSGKAAKPNTFICGYIMWEFPRQNVIGFFRLEQNVVQTDIFQSMPFQEAAQLMSDWHCPSELIETMLGVSIQ